MKLSLSLSTQAKLMVLFPVLCQLILGIILFQIVSNVQSETDEAFQTRTLIAEGHKLARDLFTAIGEMREMAPKNVFFSPELCVDDMRLLGQHVPEYTAKLAKFADLQQDRDALQAAWHQILRAYTDALRVRNTGVQLQNEGIGSRLWDGITINALQFHMLIKQIVQHEEAKSKIASDRSRAFRGQLPLVFGTAVAASAILAVLMACLYAVRIRNPLVQVAENATRLSQQIDLLPTLQGANEIARVDDVLHAVAEAIASARSKDRAMVDNAADMICTLSGDSSFIEANLFARALLGVHPEMLSGKSLYDFVLAEDTFIADEQFRSARESQDNVTFDLRMRRLNGLLTDTRWSVFWSKAQQCFFCVVTDVTEQKNIERMKQDFVNMVSHDLRSPLTAMLGSMALISEGACGPIDERAQTEIKSAARNIERLVSFVNDLLDFQKLSSGRMDIQYATCDLRELIVESSALVKDFAVSRGLALDMNRVRADLSLECDATKVRQTLVNLLSNAIKFTAANSTIVVEAEESPDAVTIRITDHGPGLPDEYKERIFEAFEQTPAQAGKREGTGLGLAICKLVVQAHGGSIGVESEAEKRPGSTFWFSLPRKANSQITLA